MKTINTMEKQQSNLVVSLKFQSYATPAFPPAETLAVKQYKNRIQHSKLVPKHSSLRQNLIRYKQKTLPTCLFAYQLSQLIVNDVSDHIHWNQPLRAYGVFALVWTEEIQCWKSSYLNVLSIVTLQSLKETKSRTPNKNVTNANVDQDWCTCMSFANSYSSSVSTFTNRALSSYSTAS